MSSGQRKTQSQTTIFKDAYSTPIRLQTIISGESRTKQHFKDECDVNLIVARFQATGEMPNINTIDPQYLDVTEMDFQAHQNFIAGAQTMFNEMPSAIRSRFENSPAKFLDFCSQDKNRQEMAEMGLLRPVPPPVVPMPTPELSTAQNASNPISSSSSLT
ncbi:MAG: internal scaffolding protein [Microviridae sp.]|nr:MAG: internal scaffolding protein [Microviridae sp.]